MFLYFFKEVQKQAELVQGNVSHSTGDFGERSTGRGKGRLLDVEMFYILVLGVVTQSSCKIVSIVVLFFRLQFKKLGENPIGNSKEVNSGTHAL